VKILVDNGSQQPPLMSTSLATEVGLSDIQVDGAECVNGDILPINSVDRVNLTVNGRSEDLKFYSADIHPYDVILGEDWLHHNGAILDYDSCQLLTRDGHGCVTPLRLNELPSGEEAGVKSASVMSHTHQSGGRDDTKLFFWVLIDLIIGFLDLIIKALDNRTENWS
jgi:hypothetical protein